MGSVRGGMPVSPLCLYVSVCSPCAGMLAAKGLSQSRKQAAVSFLLPCGAVSACAFSAGGRIAPGSFVLCVRDGRGRDESAFPRTEESAA